MAKQSRVDAIREMTKEYFTSDNPGFMKLELAIEVVLELANETLTRIETNGSETLAERDSKQVAIDTVTDFFTNNVFDGTD